jgi:hydrophobe/amphiphile efflux-1 (HAE1) family protein
MDAHYFIRRPRFAGVLSLVVVLAGLMSLGRLPVAEYPDVAPPMVWAMASYPGATAKTVADTVAAPIEDQINNLDGLLYFSGECSNDGGYSLSATFRPGTDADMALVNVNNTLKLVESSLPAAVAKGGLTAEKRSPGMVGVLAIRSSRMSDLELSNWADRHVIDELRRVPGVGKVSNEMAMDWAMRVWLDPERMAALGVTAADVREAIESQNAEAAAGSVGAEYADGEMTYKIAARGRLAAKEEFERITVRGGGGDPVRRVELGDVARVELGAQSYQGSSRFQGDMAVAVTVYKSAGANSLEVMAAVKRRMGEIALLMPEGMTWDVAYDSTTFVAASMREIAWTILLTFLLVVGITWLFLGSWRATLIPALAIPVSLVGTFAFLDAFGMSVNTLTLFGFVLVIGSVVDNAICVTESCVRLLAEGRTPAEAAAGTMRELSGAMVAATLVVLAVYAPVAFAGGMVGTIYLQFAATMCVALVLSTLCALTLSPALAAQVLRPPRRPPRDRVLGAVRRAYAKASGFLARRAVLALLLLAALCAGAWGAFRALPGGFLPGEDKGELTCSVTLPFGTARAKTEQVVREIAAAIAEIPGVATVLETGGQNEHAGEVMIQLDPWDGRRAKGISLEDVQEQIHALADRFPDAELAAVVPPPIEDLAEKGGVTFALQALDGQGYAELDEAALRLVRGIRESGLAAYAESTFDARTPMIDFRLDRDKAEAMGVRVADVFGALESELGSEYVNDFNIGDKTCRVVLQADRPFRGTVRDLDRLAVTSRDGAQVPLSALGTFGWTLGSHRVERFNLFTAASIDCGTAPGVSNAELMDKIEQLKTSLLGRRYGIAWTGLSWQERQNAGRIAPLFALSVLMAYLFLVAQYESWTLPISVVLSVAAAVAGGLVALLLSGGMFDIYAQLGLLMLVGLSAKTTILMVECSHVRSRSGVSPYRAAMAGLRLRFRAVMMTALSFVIGVLPLLVATGPGAGARRAIGVVTFWGMLAATVIGVILVPPLYVATQYRRAAERRRA